MNLKRKQYRRPRTWGGRIVRRWFGFGLIWLWLTCGLIAGALYYSVPGNSDTRDEAFIRTIDAEGITYPSRAYAIDAARAVCEVIDSGVSVVETVAEADRVSPMSLEDTAFFVGASIAAMLVLSILLLIGSR